MTDWESDTYVVETDQSDLVKPPILLMVTTGVVALLSLGLVLVSSHAGYLVAVIASVIGGIANLQDQKRRGDSNYIILDWFKPTLRSVRYFVLLVAVIQIAILAVNAANGGGILP